jgi:hypothetical protein
MAFLVLKTVVKLKGIRTWMYVEVAAYLPMFLKNNLGLAKFLHFVHSLLDSPANSLPSGAASFQKLLAS